MIEIKSLSCFVVVEKDEVEVAFPYRYAYKIRLQNKCPNDF